MHLHRALSDLELGFPETLPAHREESGVAHHPMVRSDGPTVDRPSAHDDLEGVLVLQSRAAVEHQEQKASLSREETGVPTKL